MNTRPPDRTAIEEIWRQRLKTAKLRLEFARNYVHEVLHDSSLGDIPAPDSAFARSQALRSETHALLEYRWILRVYADLILRDVIPDEAAWLNRRAVGESEAAD